MAFKLQLTVNWTVKREIQKGANARDKNTQD